MTCAPSGSGASSGATLLTLYQFVKPAELAVLADDVFVAAENYTGARLITSATVNERAPLFYVFAHLEVGLSPTTFSFFHLVSALGKDLSFCIADTL